MINQEYRIEDNFIEQISKSTYFSSPCVPIRLKVRKLPILLGNLKSLNSKMWGINIEIIRSESDMLDGSLISQLQRNGVEKITTNLFLDKTKALQTLFEIHFLRECAANYVQVNWSLNSKYPVDCKSLVHLPPPTHVSTEFIDWAHIWRKNYQIESLTYRKGPQYIKVEDTRAAFEAQIFELTDKNETDLFYLTREPFDSSNLKNDNSKVIKECLENFLFFQIEGWVLNLTIPMNRKSIPYLY